jgi:hypothetical protein
MEYLTNNMIWGVPEMGYPNSWMVYNGKSENKVNDLGVPQF